MIIVFESISISSELKYIAVSDIFFSANINTSITDTRVIVHPRCVSAWYPPAFTRSVRKAVRFTRHGIKDLVITAIAIATAKLNTVDKSSSIP